MTNVEDDDRRSQRDMARLAILESCVHEVQEEDEAEVENGKLRDLIAIEKRKEVHRRTAGGNVLTRQDMDLGFQCLNQYGKPIKRSGDYGSHAIAYKF